MSLFGPILESKAFSNGLCWCVYELLLSLSSSIQISIAPSKIGVGLPDQWTFEKARVPNSSWTVEKAIVLCRLIDVVLLEMYLAHVVIGL